MTAVDLLMELKLIESGWRPTGLGYWMPTYTEEEWERLSIEVHAAQAAAQARCVPRSNLARFAQGPKTASELVQLASDTDLKYSAFEKRIDTLKNDVAKRAEQINADMDRLTDLPRHQRTALAGKELTRFSRELREKTSEERYAGLRDLQEPEAAVNAVAPLYDSPAHMLSREGFGTDDRSRYLAQMANSGPTEVANYAALAVNTGKPWAQR